MENTGRPLDGIVVLDMTQALSGPIATCILADYGATVIKIESTKGSDITRGTNYDKNVPSDPEIGGENFNAINRNKLGISIDTRSEDGKAILRELAKKADVLISNFRPGVTQKIGIDYESLKDINPGLICCEIAGFREKERENEPAFDVVIQAASGILASTGYPDAAPAKVSCSICDISAGLHMVQGIMFALYERIKTGKGQAVNVRMQDAAMYMLAQYATPCVGVEGFDLHRSGMSHVEATPSNGYQTSDGYILIAPASDKLFAQFCDMIGRPEMKTDPRFATNNERYHHRKDLDAILNAIFITKTTQEWYEKMSEAGLPASPIVTPREAFQKAYQQGADIVATVQHKTRGPMPVIGTVCEMSRTPAKIERPAPALGEHTRMILKEFGGMTDADVDAYRNKGIVRCFKE